MKPRRPVSQTEATCVDDGYNIPVLMATDGDGEWACYL